MQSLALIKAKEHCTSYSNQDACNLQWSRHSPESQFLHSNIATKICVLMRWILIFASTIEIYYFNNWILILSSTKIWILLVAWELWKERNVRTFQRKEQTTTYILLKIKEEARAWGLAGAKRLVSLITGAWAPSQILCIALFFYWPVFAPLRAFTCNLLLY
jgi:hypothetical protein